jgi:hypothetical protein
MKPSRRTFASLRWLTDSEGGRAAPPAGPTFGALATFSDRTGTYEASEPMSVVLLVTINNRSLAALSEAGIRPTNVTVIDKGLVPLEILNRLREVPTALGEALPSPNIAVTPSMTDWTIIRTISVRGVP